MRARVLAALAAIVLSRPAQGQVVHGAVVDSASGKGVAGATVHIGGTSLQANTDALGRFALGGVPRGEQLLTIHTPSLDSISAAYSLSLAVSAGTTSVAVRVPTALQIAATACGDRTHGTGGILLGKLRFEGDSTASLSGTVTADWRPGAPGIESQDSSRLGREDRHWASATADVRGRFALCDVPLDSGLTILAVTDRGSGQESRVRVPSSARFARTEIVVRAQPMAVFAGYVFADSTAQAISGAEVSLPKLGMNTVTDARGAFVLENVPSGMQQVTVRRMGYGPVDAQLRFTAGQVTQGRVTMARAVALDSVVVTGQATDRALGDFDDNKRLGLGHVLTRADLAPQEGRSTGAVLTTIPGIKVFARGPYAWVGSGRHNVTSLANALQVGLDIADELKHAPAWDCYALVYVDDHMVFRGQKMPSGMDMHGGPPYRWEPLFDVNSIPVSEIEAIEYYATAAQTPTKYATLESECGVLVIHTIRYHPNP